MVWIPEQYALGVHPHGKYDMGESRWIILIDKTPRGPLTLEEVRLLIEQKVVRMNDLASKIDSAAGGGKAEWKFLWQYAEFDRRKETADKPSTPNVPERRANGNPEKLEEKKKELLPQELDGIQMEDLAYHSTTTSSGSQSKEGKDFSPTLNEMPALPGVASTGFGNRWAFAVVPLLLGAGYWAYNWVQKNDGKPKAKMAISPFPNARVPSSQNQGGGGSSPLSRTNGSRPAVNESKPDPIHRPTEVHPEPERGSISEERRREMEEEAARAKYEEDAKKQLEDEARDETREEAGGDAQEEEAPAPKAKTKKASKHREAASEEDEVVSDPLEETIDDEAPRD